MKQSCEDLSRTMYTKTKDFVTFWQDFDELMILQNLVYCQPTRRTCQHCARTNVFQKQKILQDFDKILWKSWTNSSSILSRCCKIKFVIKAKDSVRFFIISCQDLERSYLVCT